MPDASETIEIPKRALFKAGEVCDLVKVQPYVLRTWEAEFPALGVAKTAGGPRVYRRADVELVLRIKQLILEEGLTLSGARRRLEEDGGGPSNGAGMMVEEVLGDRVRDRLKHVKSGLQSILQLLSKDVESQPELQLVAPQPAKKKPVAKTKGKK